MRALPPAPTPARPQIRVPSFVVLSFVVSLTSACSQSAIGTVDDGLDGSAPTGSTDLDASIVVRGFDAARSAPAGDAESASDAALGDGGCVGSSCQVFDCPDGQVPTICGCSAPDSDADGTPDCADECPSDRNKKLAGSCGCGVSDQDTDLDGTPDCKDTCSGKPEQTYTADSSCGVGYCHSHNHASTCVNGVETQCKAGAPLASSDSTCDGVDDDCDGQVDEDYGMSSSSCGEGVCARTGTVSCVNGHVSDSCAAGAAPTSSDTSCDGKDDDCDGSVDEEYPAKPSSCAAGACASTGTVSCSNGKVVDSCSARAPIASTDTTCDNVDDDCDGMVDDDYKSTSTKCGVGACANTGTKSCSKGSVVDSCKAKAKPSNDDTSCNNVDDDCNGKVDDGYAASATHCGVGVCAASGATSCANGSTKDSCVAGAPTSSSDDAFSPGNGLDDDCDGKIDEDVPPCNTAPMLYEVGSYPDIAVPGNCHSVSVSLWGGGGAGGEEQGFANVSGGAGGPGGFASATALISGKIALSVGGGGASGCNAAGSNAETSSYNGGSGGGGSGDPGGDGSAQGGGGGGGPKSGQHGGDGHFGGGGGGAGNGGLIGASGDGGGGGAASVLTINGVRAAVAGGGGGGGGAQGALLGVVASRGGAGGSGCGADGQVETSTGGGGGGGGLCVGAVTQTGSGTTPASSDRVPDGRARGGSSSCNAGGAGYAIITFSP